MSQAVVAQKTLKQVTTLQMAEGDGSNAAAVVWHPVQKKYYTTMVGNAIYAMAYFDAKGKSIEQNIEAENDYRGLWYNTQTKQLEFNCYNEGGMGHIDIEKNGKIGIKTVDVSGMKQPNDQCVGFYYPVENAILYLTSDFKVEKYDAKTGESIGTLVKIYPGCKTQADADAVDYEEEAKRQEDRNSTVVIYTGIAGGELAIMNTVINTIELYNIKTGFQSKQTFKAPAGIEIASSFNFSYANGLWWFFDKSKRKWFGCK